MTRAEKTTIENIIAVCPYIYGLQENIEREQEQVISDLVSPAKAVVAKLFVLDNRRIDLCNLKVLNEFIKRNVTQPLDGELCSKAYKEAKKAVELAGYTLDRAEKEFAYLFKKLKRRRKNDGKIYGVALAAGAAANSECGIRN